MGLNYCYCPVIQQAIWTNYHRYPIQISIRHVKTCASDLSCDFTLFLVGPFSGKQIPAPATVFNTHYFMPGAKSLISLIHFLFFHPLFLQLSRCSLVMLPPCCCYLILYFKVLSKLSHWCCTRRLRKGFHSANYSKP